MFGLTTLEARLIGYAALLAACLGAYMYWHHTIFAEGVASESTKVIIRDAGAAKAAADRIRTLETQARATEAQHAARVNDITTKLRNDNAAEQIKHDAVVAGLRDGTARLYVNLAGAATSCGAAASTATGTAPGTDGAGNTGYLGSDDATVLVTEFARSDARARKVNALQALALDQIRTCNQ